MARQKTAASGQMSLLDPQTFALAKGRPAKRSTKAASEAGGFTETLQEYQKAAAEREARWGLESWSKACPELLVQMDRLEEQYGAKKRNVFYRGGRDADWELADIVYEFGATPFDEYRSTADITYDCAQRLRAKQGYHADKISMSKQGEYGEMFSLERKRKR